MNEILRQMWEILDPLEEGQNPAVQLSFRDIKIFSIQEFEILKQNQKKTVPSLIELNKQFGFKLASAQWNYVFEGQEYSGGEFCIYNPFWVYSEFSLPDYLMQNSPFSKEDLFILDEHPFSGDGHKVIAGITENTINDLYLVDVNANFFPLDLNLETYIDLSIKTRGFYYWQYLFAKDISDIDKEAIKSIGMNRLVDHLPKLFTDTDFSLISERYINF